jgi:hypothetical protein
MLLVCDEQWSESKIVECTLELVVKKNKRLVEDRLQIHWSSLETLTMAMAMTMLFETLQTGFSCFQVDEMWLLAYIVVWEVKRWDVVL